ncbi:MAG: undecaprenyl-diphosphate phosphatase [Bacteroidales bacterium]|nr:undecaprenyl-diphosphate phosphatase [Bacteroidales bacterium]MCF8456477.1 undecaprenyl-diphosphate phosphatase [Bacteroidales bacterium]
MHWLEALILGLVQGLSEFLPISSSGHLEIGKEILNVTAKDNITFTVVVHGATVLSTIIVFWKDIVDIFKGLFEFKWNESTQYALKIIVSMIPVLIVGVFFADEVESFFGGQILFVGWMLLITSALLAFTYYAKPRAKSISYRDSFIIGIAQAIAVLPGISRSGSTIATGLLLGNQKEGIAKFSFLMVLVPIIGGNLKDMFSAPATGHSSIGALPLMVGFLAAFISGLLACKWMVSVVKKGKLIYFAIYCFIVGSIAIVYGFM